MARYVTSLRTERSPSDAFNYMADLRNFAEWDPGVRKVTQISGDGGGPSATFDVTVASVGRDMKLRYVTKEYAPSSALLVVAETSKLISTDRITVRPDGDGSIVTYDADLQFRGIFKVFDLGLKLAFNRIGDRAAAGLRKALDGTKVDA